MPLTSTANPFDSVPSIEHSNYCRPDGGRLVGSDGSRPSALTEFVHRGFRALILDDGFACIGAKAAARQDSYRFGLYPPLASAAAVSGLAHDLFTFLSERDRFGSDFVTFAASFGGPPPPDEAAFERQLWSTLQQLHDLDACFHGWDARVRADAADPYFSFSFAETALFVVGLHAGSSRATRRFAWPTLVFNPHDQFERLRASGRFQRFQDVIRAADLALQGSINPMVKNFGERSEAAQYSGRAVDPDWRCPFQASHEREDDQS